MERELSAEDICTGGPHCMVCF